MQSNLERGKVWMKKSEDCKIWQSEEFFFTSVISNLDE